MATQTTSWPPPPDVAAGRGINVGSMERWMSAAAGAALVGAALRRRSAQAWVLGAIGSALLYRATTGQCPVYSAMGVTTADDNTRRALSGAGGVHAEAETTIDRPIEEVFAFWRNLENLPRVMDHLESVTDLGNRRSRWVARAPIGTVEWEAEIHNEVRNKLIGWRSLEGSTVVTAGSVNFDPIDDDRGTRVRVKLQYDPPAGKLGAWVASLFGEEPNQQIREDLRRFKEVMERGESSTFPGQLHTH